MPPLPKTWPASRSCPLAYFSFKPCFCFLNMRLNADEVIKKVSSSTAHCHPPIPKMIIPVKAAAYAPVLLRVRARYASHAIRSASRKPKMNCFMNLNRSGDNEQDCHQEQQAGQHAGT